jgi:hypothetical protein
MDPKDVYVTDAETRLVLDGVRSVLPACATLLESALQIAYLQGVKAGLTKSIKTIKNS